MNINPKIISKTMMTALLAFFASAGACYPPTRTVSNEKIKATDVFTRYQIEEYARSEDGKCRRRITTQFSGDNKIYLLQPPARATYNGTEIRSIGGDNYAEFSCDGDRAEFILTDDQGETKTEIYELKRAKVKAPKVNNRTIDLLISVELDEAYVYEFSGTFETDDPNEPVFFRFFPVKDESDLAARLNDPDAPQNQAYFLPGENQLVIPKTILAVLPAGDAKLGISFEQSMFKPKLNDPASSLKSQALVYEYSFEAKLKLK